MTHLNTVKIQDGESYRIINESDFKQNQHQLYEDATPSNESINLNVKVGITPELQQVIADAKAECEKAVAENEALKEQIIALENGAKEYSDLTSENSRLKDQLTLSEKNIGELQTVIDSLNKTVAELESKPKKPTAAEVKAAKAAEEIKPVEQPKE